MDKKKSVRSWLDTAVAGIRFKPDRAAVERELREHIEDKIADLCRLYPDLSQEEAEDMALGRMGDPKEIGRELAKIHKPLWGCLWELSKVLVAVAVLGLVAIAFWQGDDAFLGDDPASELWDFDGLPGNGILDYGANERNGRRGSRARYQPSQDPDQLMAQRRGQSVWVNGQRVSLRHAALWQERDGRALYLSLRVETPMLWARGDLNEDWMTITDSLGNLYSFEWTDSGRENETHTGGYGPFHSCTEVILWNLDREAEWVRLDYGPQGELFSMTVELERGDGT